jgi:hypothetical protein
MKVKKVTTLHSVVHRCCADELYIVRPRPTARITLCPRQYTRPDPSCKGSKMGDGIVSAEVLSCWINPNWQAPLVHQILEPGKGSKHLNSTNDNVWQWQGSEAQVAKVLKRGGRDGHASCFANVNTRGWTQVAKVPKRWTGLSRRKCCHVG